MKTHWSLAPDRIRKDIVQHQRTPTTITSLDGTHQWQSAAASYVEALMCSFRYGYTYDPPATPRLDEQAKLREAGDRLALIDFERAYAVELDQEQSAKLRWGSLEKWRNEPSNEAVAEAARKQREAEALERKVEARAQEIIATENAKRLEAARAKARKEVETNG